jgi:hypothetical protein
VLARDGHRCQIRSPVCIGIATICDHILDWRVTGPTFDPDLLRAACRPCNNWRSQGKDSPERKSTRSSCPHRIGDKWCYELNLPGHWARRWPVAEGVRGRAPAPSAGDEDDEMGYGIA